MKKIIMLGGIYGSGKSTTAMEIAESYFNNYSTSIVDSDSFFGNGTGKQVDYQNWKETARRAWDREMIPSIIVASESHELIIFIGSFYTHDRRQRYYDTLSEIADVTALFYMLPMRETIDRIRRGRRDDTHLVNTTRYREFYKRFNQQFKEDNQSDLLLPHDRDRLTPEYLALLTKRKQNRELVVTPQLDKTRPHRWIVIPEPLRIETFMNAIQKGILKPYEMRQALGYGNRDKQSIGFYR